MRPARPGNRRVTLRDGKPERTKLNRLWPDRAVSILRQVATVAPFGAFERINRRERRHGQGRAKEQSRNKETEEGKDQDDRRSAEPKGRRKLAAGLWFEQEEIAVSLF